MAIISIADLELADRNADRFNAIVNSTTRFYLDESGTQRFTWRGLTDRVQENCTALMFADKTAMDAYTPLNDNAYGIDGTTGETYYWVVSSSTWVKSVYQITADYRNRGVAFPFTTQGTRNGQTPLPIASMAFNVRNWMLNIFRGIEVIDADPNYFYYIGYHAHNATPLVQVYAVLRSAFNGSTGGVSVYNSTVAVDTSLTGTDFTYVIDLNTAPLDPSYKTRLKVNLNIDNYNASTGDYTAFQTTHSGFGWIVNPFHYEFVDNSVVTGEIDSLGNRVTALEAFEAGMPAQLDATSRNIGVPQPHCTQGNRNNQAPLPLSSMSTSIRNWLLNVFSDISVIDAHPDYYYMIGFMGRGANPTLQVYALPKASFATSNTGTMVFNATVAINTGITDTDVTVLVDLNTSVTGPDYKTKFSLTINVANYNAMTGDYTATATTSSSYGWIIDPRHYIVMNQSEVDDLESRVSVLEADLPVQGENSARNIGVSQPFNNQGSRGGTAVVPIASMSGAIQEWIKNVIIGATIDDADPNMFYQIGFLGRGAAPVLQVYAVPRATYASTGASSQVFNAALAVTTTLGDTDVTFRVELASATNHKPVLVLTLNLAAYNAMASDFVGWNNTHSAYAWIIDPRGYVYLDRAVTALQSQIDTNAANISAVAENASRNKGSLFPFTQTAQRNNVTSVDLSGTNGTIAREVFLDVEFINVIPGFYYQIGYYILGSAYTMQVYMINKTGFATGTDTTMIYNGPVVPVLDGKIHTYELDLVIPDSRRGAVGYDKLNNKAVLRVTMDSTAIAANAGAAYVATNTSNSGYGWIIDETRYTYVPVSTTLNRGTIFPYVNCGRRNNVNPPSVSGLSQTTRDILNNVIMDVKVIGALPGWFYKVGYMMCDTNGAVQFEAINKTNYRTQETRQLLHNAAVGFELGVGIRTYTFVVNGPNASAGHNVTVQLTVDTDAMQSYQGSELVMWNTGHTGYTLYVDESRYEYAVDATNYLKLPRPSFGTTPAETSSTRLGIDPIAEHTADLNGGVTARNGNHGILPPSSVGNISFLFNSCLENSFDRQYNFFIGTRADIPLLAIDSGTENSMIDHMMFRPFAMCEGGWLYWTLSNATPLHGRLKGSLTLYRKVPDATTRLQVQLSIRGVYSQPAAITDTQQLIGLGMADNVPAELVSEEMLYLTTADPNQVKLETFAGWGQGFYAKFVIPVDMDVSFYPDCQYCFSLTSVVKAGSILTVPNFARPGDVIVASGGLSMQYNARARMSALYANQIEGKF
ncbi:hypothetical protein QJS83_14735 [Bdellovibrio sp. 22V]|uniref:hypothetical protein n=1 Tax=Bdellovibrio sp. 22V TaxID=3044166 RepID=UPI0025436D38|nr:hypothetical protein [Bdellovibrio sp. 22V]WII71719.1 hypothetical protein QJS83_14735 [Bdellovibrio sp. 22V]